MSATKTEKTTVRSTSTRLTLRGRINDLEAELLIKSREAEEREHLIAGLDASIKSLTIQRDNAYASERRAAVLEAQINNGAKKVRSLFGTVVKLQMESAQLKGYIDRVRELDRISATDVTEPVAGEDYLTARDALMNASRQSQIDRIIDSVDEQTLEAILGRTDDDSPSDLLR